MEQTANLTKVTPRILCENPAALEMLRMSTAPPIARDRLIGLADVSVNLVKCIETECRVPPRMSAQKVETDLQKICTLIMKLADRDIFPWLETKRKPSLEDAHRASTIVADRLCGAQSDPIIRNAQEKRQFAAIREWLENNQYSYVESAGKLTIDAMKQGTFTFRLNIPVNLATGKEQINVPVDVAIMSKQPVPGELPLLIEAKSAGDFTNTNKRRKEEAQKLSQLTGTYGRSIRYILFLCGYFNPGYLGYSASDGIDWVWEHRIDDLAEFGL